MPSDSWNAAHPLARLVRRRAPEFEFFQLINLIERVEPTAARVGNQGPARDEIVRLRPALSFGFPVSDIESAEWAEDAAARGRLAITLTFLGLYGSNSPLPAHFTEALLLAKDDPDEYLKDELVRGFLDIFHHRVYSLLYRVWLKYRYYATFQKDGHDPISEIIRGFLGLGTAALDDKMRVNPVRLFRYAGLLSQKPRSTAGLIAQLSDYFSGIGVDVEQCVGRWLRIDVTDQNRIGERNSTLGVDLLLGEQKFDRSGKFRVKLGPVGFAEYCNFLPPGDGARDLAALVTFYTEDPLEFDLQLTIRGDEVPETPLEGPGMLGRLSWTSWLKSKPCDDKSVIFRVSNV